MPMNTKVKLRLNRIKKGRLKMMKHQTCIILHLLVCMGSIIQGNKVLFLVVEGLTERLIGQIATPAIDALIAKGAIAGLKPEFPSETLPTLHSMMTGQHTEVTGVLDLEVRGSLPDQVLRFDEDVEYWKYSNNLTTVWNLNNQMAGHRTGSIMWPGAEFPIGGVENSLRWGAPYDMVVEVNNVQSKVERRKRHPDEEPNKDSFSFEEADLLENANSSFMEYVFNKTTDQEWIMWNSQIETTVSWLSQNSDPVNFVLFNVKQPGQQIRAFGPESEEAGFAVQKVDEMIANLVEQLQEKKIFDDVNIIITGCHGFTEVSTDKVFDISGRADIRDFIGQSPVININAGMKALDTYGRLKVGDLKKYDLYTKNTMPDRYHYKNNDRVDDIVLVAKEGFVFASDFWAEVKKLNKEQNRPSNLNNKYGIAGYDNALDSMQSLIILHGPGVKTQLGPEHLNPMIYAVDVFPLLSHLLELPPVASKGSLHAVRNLLKNPQSQSSVNFYPGKDKLPTTESPQEHSNGEVIMEMVNYMPPMDKVLKTVIVLSMLVLLILICFGAWTSRRQKTMEKNQNYPHLQVFLPTSGVVMQGDGCEKPHM